MPLGGGDTVVFRLLFVSLTASDLSVLMVLTTLVLLAVVIYASCVVQAHR